MKILHTADWHWSDTKKERCLESAESILAWVREIQPDLHVIAGDWWDRRQVLASTSAVLPAMGMMKELAEVSPIVLIYGNSVHDAPGSLDLFQDLRTRYPVHVARRPESLLLVSSGGHKSFTPLSIGRLQGQEILALMHLLPYPTRPLTSENGEDREATSRDKLFLEAIQRIFEEFSRRTSAYALPTVFAGHCHVTGARSSAGQVFLSDEMTIGLQEIRRAGAHYNALGHIHLCQALDPRTWYAGSSYHQNFGEPEEKYCLLAEISHDQLTVERLEITSRPLSLHEATFDPQANEIRDSHPGDDWKDADLRVRLHLTREQMELITDEQIARRYQGAYSITIERLLTPHVRARLPEIAHLRTLPEKLLCWGSSLKIDITPEHLRLAGELERAHLEGGTP